MDTDKKEPDGHIWADPVYYPHLREHQRRHREYPTTAEAYLWEYLRANRLGVRFRREYIIAEHIADFVCLPLKLVIEVDGGYHDAPLQQRADEIRTLDLEQMGFEVIRFTNDEVLNNIDKVLKEIIEKINNS
ncbi:MAG: endonuclease domain-containing protein [Bacteroidales bacterium]|nr:endonuclease domain-containing protein [Bacteroidales bacterium]